MKKVLALLLALCFVVSLAACGGSGNNGNVDVKLDDLDSSATLEVDIWDSNQLDGLREIANEWSKETGVKVNINVISWVEYWTLLEAGASGGEMPDVFWMHINEAQKYMRAEKLLGLNDFIAADDIAIFRKLICREAEEYLCMTCLAEDLGIPRKKLEDIADYYH